MIIQWQCRLSPPPVRMLIGLARLRRGLLRVGFVIEISFISFFIVIFFLKFYVIIIVLMLIIKGEWGKMNARDRGTMIMKLADLMDR